LKTSEQKSLRRYLMFLILRTIKLTAEDYLVAPNIIPDNIGISHIIHTRMLNR